MAIDDFDKALKGRFGGMADDYELMISSGYIKRKILVDTDKVIWKITFLIDTYIEDRLYLKGRQLMMIIK